MSHHRPQPARRRATAAAGALLSLAALLAPASLAGAQEPPARPAADTLATESTESSGEVHATAMATTLAVGGHGWGHGRGMGQYGAFGYATGFAGDPLDHQQILGHFYGGTDVGHINDNPMMSVLLKWRTGSAMVIYRETGLVVPGVTGNPTAVRVTLRPDGRFDVQTGTSCLDTGGGPTVQVDGPVRVDPVPESGDKALRLCRSDGSAIAYKGSLVAFGRSFDGEAFSEMRTVNLVHMDELMRGVVPRESPASWGDAAGGLGMAALRAQAVAARSYAAAGDSRWGDLHSGLGARATTCDDIFCQVYGGLAEISPSGAVTYRTHPNTDRAVAETGGEVRMRSGQVARTEFSSSTGGWTAGGTFPAVVDLGDAVDANPNHAWSMSVDRSAVESRYGLGTLTDVEITERNGFGDMGGRVEQLRLVGTSGSEVVTGNQFRSAFRLKSDWFSITEPPKPPVPPRDTDTACPPDQPSAEFSDVDSSNVHSDAIDCLVDHLIAEGTGDGRFSPALAVTRAQMASFTARMITSADGTLPCAPPDAFGDDDDSVHERAINQLAAIGVVNGTSAGVYGPKQDVDRAQLASMLARAVDHLGVSLTSSNDAFDDDTGSVHEEAINQLAAEGVVTGVSAGTYRPSATTRRDQMASMIARALDLAMEEGSATTAADC